MMAFLKGILRIGWFFALGQGMAIANSTHVFYEKNQSKNEKLSGSEKKHSIVFKKNAFDVVPMVKNFLIKIKNQKMVISDEGPRAWGQHFGTPWSYDQTPSISLKKNEGIKFGTFVHGQAMVYVRAGIESKPIRFVPKTPWDHGPLAPSSHTRNISPGLGVQWGKKDLFLSGEIRASLPAHVMQIDSFYGENKKNKASNTLLFQARYKLGAKNLEKRTPLKKGGFSAR